MVMKRPYDPEHDVEATAVSDRNRAGSPAVPSYDEWLQRNAILPGRPNPADMAEIPHGITPMPPTWPRHLTPAEYYNRHGGREWGYDSLFVLTFIQTIGAATTVVDALITDSYSAPYYLDIPNILDGCIPELVINSISITRPDNVAGGTFWISFRSLYGDDTNLAVVRGELDTNINLTPRILTGSILQPGPIDKVGSIVYIGSVAAGTTLDIALGCTIAYRKPASAETILAPFSGGQ